MFRTVSQSLLRLLAVLVTVVTVAIALFAWRIASGPLALEWLTPYIAEALSDEEQGVQVAVGGTQLRLSDDVHLLELVVVDVEARGEDGALLVELPEVEIGLSLQALLRGMVAVARLEATAPHLLLLRREDGSIGLQAEQAGGGEIDLRQLVGALLKPPAPDERAGYFERLEIAGGRLTLADRRSGQRLAARDAELVLLRQPDGLSGDLVLSLEQPQAPIAVRVSGRYHAATEWLRFDLGFDGLVPAAFAALAPDLPLGGLALPLDGSLSGGVKADGERTPLRFELSGGPGEVDLPAVLAAPLPIETVQAAGELASDLEHLTLARFAMTALGAELSGTAALLWPGGEFAASAEVAARNVAAEDLERFWPPKLGARARGWVVEHISAGSATQAQATISIQPGDLAQRPVREGVIEGRFSFEDLSVRYFRDLPPLTGADGSASFTARRMDFEVDTARIDGIAFEDGTVVITGMGLPGRDTTQLEVQARATGAVPDVLALIDHAPLHLAAKARLSPADAGGNATADLALGLPLHRDVDPDELRIAASATITDASLQRPVALQDGTLSLEVDDDGFDLAGDALVEGVPLQIAVRQNFPDGAPFQRRYQASGEIEAAAIRRLAGDLPLELAGAAGVEATVVEAAGTRDVEVAVDLTPLAIASPWGDWRKAQGEPGSLDASLVLADDAPVEVQAFDLLAPGLQAAGHLQLQADTLALQTLTLERFRFGASAGDLRVQRGERGYEVSMAAATLDLDPLLDAAGTQDGPPEPLTLELRAERVLLTGEELTEVSADLVRDELGWRSAAIRAALPGGGDLDVSLAPAGDHRRLRVLSNDAGDLLQTVDRTSRIDGGRLDLDAAVRQQHPTLDVGGTLRVSDFTLLEAPLLARLLTVASLTGIGNLLAGEGIYFDRFEMPFTYRREVLTVERVRLSGSQLGLTAQGRLDLGRDTIDLSGTIVPIYGLNWAIGKIPVLGDFLRGAEGEGAFAMTYSATGDLDEPTILVNPLSVLAPGMIRELFSGLFGGTAEPPEVRESSD